MLKLATVKKNLKLAENKIYENVTKSLIQAWKMYKNVDSCLIMIVRDLKHIYADQRLIEYKLLELEPNINFQRLTLSNISKYVKLDDQSRLLM